LRTSGDSRDRQQKPPKSIPETLRQANARRADRIAATANAVRDLKKSGGLLREGERVKFAFIEAEKVR
jgi:hypothetical protein